MEEYNINGWEKLKGVHQLFRSNLSTVQIDIILARKSDIPLVCPTTFLPVDVYHMKFKIYHPSKGTSNQLRLRLTINQVDGNCEIKVDDGNIRQYHNWFKLNVHIDKFKSPTIFLGWVINTINKQHKYFDGCV